MKTEIVTLKDSICAMNSNKDIFLYETIGYHSRFELRRKLREDKTFVIDSVPQEHQNKDYEINMIYTHRKRDCYKATFFRTAGYVNLPLSYETHTQEIGANFINKHTDLTPIKHEQAIRNILFEKNKAVFDTLLLIKSISAANIDPASVQQITVNAYASIEGLTGHNDSLAIKRGKAIINTLDSLGYHSDSTLLNTTVNWELFYEQIDNDRFGYLKQLSQDEIKEELNKNTLLYQEFKTKLDSQRTANITIDYTVSPHANTSSNSLQRNIKSLIYKRDYEQAEHVLFELFSKVYYDTADIKIFEAVNIPGIETDSTINHLFFTWQYFKYLLNPKPETYSLQKLNSLLKINPNDYDLLYYSIDMGKSKFYTDTKKFQEKIKWLKHYPVSRTDINKLLIRFYIGSAGYEFRMLNYRKKKAHSKTAYSLLKRTKLTKPDITTGANALNHFHENDLAVKLLKPYITRKKYDKEMLFSYLSFIMPYPLYTHKRDFMILTKKAIEIDKKRFMNFINPINRGGLSFQILKDEILYHIYCMNK
jgi:hypothetical protein